MTLEDQMPAQVGNVRLGTPSRRVHALIIEGEVHGSSLVVASNYDE